MRELRFPSTVVPAPLGVGSRLVLLAGAGLFLLGGCNLVVFDEDAARTARDAEDMSVLSSFDIPDWDERDSDDVILLPRAFLPDEPEEESGYLISIDGEEDRLHVTRVRRGSVGGRTDIRFEPTNGPFSWNAWVVPPGPHAAGGYESMLVVAFFDDSPSVAVHLIYPEPEKRDRRLVDTGFDLGGLLSERSGLSSPEIAAIQVVIEGSSGAAIAEVQMLARNAGEDPPAPLREYFLRVTGEELLLWAEETDQTPAALSAVSWSVGAASIAFPRLSEEDIPAEAVSYGNARLSDDDPTARRAFLTYADGEYRGAPLKTRTWRTNPDDPATEDALPLEAWQRPISTITVDGTIRTARTGTTRVIDARSDGASDRERVEYGTLWYAGQYPTGSGGRMIDLFSAVGIARNIRGEWTLAVQVLTD